MLDFREQTQSWHDRKRALDKLEQDLLACPLNAEDVDTLRQRCLEGRDRAVWLLNRRFGVDAIATPLRLLPWAREPQSEEEWVCYIGAVGSVKILTEVIARLRDEVMPLPPAERGSAALGIVRWAARDLVPEFTVHFARTAPTSRLAEMTAAMLTGFVRGLISYQANPRLREYLTEEAANLDGGSNPAGASSHRRWEEVFDRDLPGAVLATLHETGVQGSPAVEGEAHESWDDDAFRNAVVSSLEHQRQPQGVMPLQNVKPPPKEKAGSLGMTSSPSAEQEFLALHTASRNEERVVEERRRFRELLTSAKLSPQQVAIFERRFLDRLTNEQIAEDLGISKDQISPQRRRALKKLRAYCERSGIDGSLVQEFEEAG